MFVEHIRGSANAQYRRTTKGWQLLLKWKDRSTSWTMLKGLKEFNQIEVAEYAVTNKKVEEPVFAWWAKEILRKHDQMIGDKKLLKYIKANLKLHLCSRNADL